MGDRDIGVGRQISLPSNQWTRALVQAIRANDEETSERMARTVACLSPDSTSLAGIAKIAAGVKYLDTYASLSRMAQILDPADRTHLGDRVHRSIKAVRPDLMPPHWMRDVMREADTLQALILQAGLPAAHDFVRRADLVGSRFYMPRFRALRHFVLFNADSDYRERFVTTSIRERTVPPGRGSADEAIEDRQVLEHLLAMADWAEATDTIVSSEDNDSESSGGDKKRIRASRLPVEQFSPVLLKWKQQIHQELNAYWADQVQCGQISELFGFSIRDHEDVLFHVTFNINEIVSGSVLGPHYHSGHQYNTMVFPILSAVYYPDDIPENDKTKSGYLEIGRPDFQVPFEPTRLTVRPTAGKLIMFPAFAYHGVVPIDRGPRRSVNLDVYLKPKAASSWRISEFFG